METIFGGYAMEMYAFPKLSETLRKVFYLRKIEAQPAKGLHFTDNWPNGCQGELVLRQHEAIQLPEAGGPAPAGHRRFKLPGGGTLTLRLNFTWQELLNL